MRIELKVGAYFFAGNVALSHAAPFTDIDISSLTEAEKNMLFMSRSCGVISFDDKEESKEEESLVDMDITKSLSVVSDILDKAFEESEDKEEVQQKDAPQKRRRARR